MTEKTINFEVLKQNALTAKLQKEQAEADLEEKRQVLTDKIALLTAAWESTNAELIVSTSDAHAMWSARDSDLREAAIREFYKTGEKQIGFGVSVRLNTSYEYDEQKAVDYAISHNMPHLLKMDGTKFKKYASITPIDFVTTTETPSAVVSYTEAK